MQGGRYHHSDRYNHKGVIVKPVSPAVLAALVLIGVVACKDAVTAPSTSADPQIAFSLTSNPPPPSIDTGSRGRFLPGSGTLREQPSSPFMQPRFSIQQSLSAQPRTIISGLPRALTNDVFLDAFNFFLPVQYDLDKQLVNGHVNFKKIKHSKAVLKECHVDLHHSDEMVGHGTLTLQTNEGLLVINCESIVQPPVSWMERCGNTGDERCFHLVFSDATLYPPVGDPIQGSVEEITSCTPADVEAEEGSCPNFGGD